MCMQAMTFRKLYMAKLYTRVAQERIPPLRVHLCPRLLCLRVHLEHIRARARKLALRT